MESYLSGIIESQKQHFQNTEHEMKMELLETEQQYKLFSMLNPKVYIDGNMWAVVYGEDQISGIAGFGKTPHEAIVDFNANFHQAAGKK